MDTTKDSVQLPIPQPADAAIWRGISSNVIVSTSAQSAVHYCSFFIRARIRFEIEYAEKDSYGEYSATIFILDPPDLWQKVYNLAGQSPTFKPETDIQTDPATAIILQMIKEKYGVQLVEKTCSHCSSRFSNL